MGDAERALLYIRDAGVQLAHGGLLHAHIGAHNRGRHSVAEGGVLGVTDARGGRHRRSSGGNIDSQRINGSRGGQGEYTAGQSHLEGGESILSLRMEGVDGWRRGWWSRA